MITLSSSQGSVATKTPLDRDKLSMVPREAAASAALASLHQLSDLTPEQCLLGAAVLFTALSMRCGVDPQDLHTMARRVIMAPEDGDRHTDSQIQVLRDFAGCRLMGKDVTVQ